MLVQKLGGVPAHPANVHRLLYDEEQLVLVFPEGRKGTEKLYKDRYQLQAVRPRRVRRVRDARPGADRPRRRRRRRGGDAGLRPHQAAAEAHRADLLPDHAAVPVARPRGAPRTCRRSSTSASWSRSRPTSGATSRGTTRAWSRRSPKRSARASRRSSTRCWPTAGRCGSDEAPRPDHRRQHLLGRPPGAGAREGPGQRGDHRRQPRRPVLRAGAHRVRPRRHPARAAAADRPRGADRHRRRHAPDRRLDHGARRESPTR